MVVWMTRDREVPEAHANEFRSASREFVGQIAGLDEICFANDPDRNEEARKSFRSHFWRTSRGVDKWNGLREVRLRALEWALARTNQDSGQAEHDHGLVHAQVRAVLQRKLLSLVGVWFSAPSAPCWQDRGDHRSPPVDGAHC